MKLGIVGSGKIVLEALDVIEEIEKIDCKAICGRKKSSEKLEKLALDYKISKIYTEYEEMLKDNEIEVIYIAIINSLHFEHAKKALEAGKHVICEKPFTSTIEELKELKKIAKIKKLFLFEAITLIYSPNFEYVKQNLNMIGDIKLIQCNYSQYSSRYDKYLEREVLPVFDLSMSGGSLYDLNIYNIHFVTGLFGKPNTVNYVANKGFNGVDTSGVVVLSYDNFTAVCCGAKDSQSESHATIQGTKGYLRINSAVNESKSVESHIGKEIKKYSYGKKEHRMMREFLTFEKLFSENNLKKCYEYLKHSEIVMEILVKARETADLKFPADYN